MRCVSKFEDDVRRAICDIDLLVQLIWTIDAIRMDGWRIDVGYPEDHKKAKQRLRAERDDIKATEPPDDSNQSADATVD